MLIVASYNKNRFVPFVAEQGEALHQAGCEVEWFGIKRKGIVGYLREIPRLCKMVREVRPDIIHAHYGMSCLLANLTTRKVPVVSTFHGSDINESFARILSKIAMGLSAWNIFVSQRIMDLAEATHCQKCSLIPCGVSLSEDQLQLRLEARKVLGWGAYETKVLFAGAFDNAVKDPELALRVIEELRLQMADIELVELKGYTRQEVNRLMCAANCLLMTSKTEGSPQVVKEAMACGCPIVSVDVGDVKEQTENVAGCYIVPSRELNDIATSLKKALAFVGRTNGRERIVVSQLTNEAVAKRIINIYNTIIQKER